MSSDRQVLSVQQLSKSYRIYSKPINRLRQSVAGRLGSHKNYFHEVPAVRSVSLDLNAGEAIAIIGRNGSGKSTLLSMIAGTLEPTSGSVTKTGRVSALLELGTGFDPNFTGRENFRMNAAILGLTRREIEAIEEPVQKFADIGDFIDEPVRTYSSGMYVRLAFATAVHVVPDLLIVDEALAVGDIFFQQKCFDYLFNELADSANLIVTHDMVSAVRLAQRCIVLNQGHVVFDGEPLEAVEVYTALHLGDRSVVAPTAGWGEAASPTATGESFTGLLPQHHLPADRSSNPDALMLESVGVGVQDGAEIKPQEATAATMRPGQRLVLDLVLALNVPVAQPIVGYLVRDRVGNVLFGQNSVGSGILLQPVEPGKRAVRLVLPWPEVEPGEYTLTIGVGDGMHPHHHQIVAWMQSVLKITSIAERPVHGAFNNDLISVALQ
jgi:ABC-type polysaccharide/polyol phosphate transport system ATPase subunit